MKRFATYDWYRICRIASIVFGACAVICLWKLYNCLGASPATIRFWFVSMLVSVGLCLPCLIGFYYFRAKDASWDPKHESIAVFGSAASGKNGKNPVK